MDAQIDVKQGAIVCHACGEVIDIVDSEGVKILYGKCPQDCSRK